MWTRSTTLLVTPLLLAMLPAAVADDGATVETDSTEAVEFDRRSDNIELVARVQFPQGTDMFFQRRDGRHRLDGRSVRGPRDYLFAGADASAAVGDPPAGTPEGVRVVDVTDPTAPRQLVAIDCPGYHADVAVYENRLVQAIDSAGTNTGCAERFDPDGENELGEAGVRIFDISDPARPTLITHLTTDELGTSAHNITTLPWAGVLYVAGSGFDETDPVLSIVDLKDPDFPVTTIPMSDISPTAVAECHDIGVASLDTRALAFCAGVEQTFVWDVSLPLQPTHVSIAVGPPESIHHGARLAPDGRTLVLNDELGGAAVAPGCLPTTSDPIGALHFFDIGIPEAPIFLGSFSTSETDTKLPCTSHFYNFIPGTSLLTVGWYKSGMIVVDYSNRTRPTEHAVFTPTGGDFWSAYYWHGHVYGNSFGGGGPIGGTNEAGGIWITRLDGIGDVDPSPHDQGVTWAPWTPPDHPGKGQPAHARMTNR